MLLAGEFITEPKVELSALHALVASNGKAATAPKQTESRLLFELV
jgi:hypothetical protein